MKQSKKSRNGSKYTFELSKIITSAIEKGSSFEEASRLAGISRPTIYAWKKKYSGFADRLDQAVARQEISLVNQIIQSDDWRAKAFILERRFPDRWSKNRAIEINRTDVESKLSEIQRLATHGIICSEKASAKIKDEEYG